MQERFLKVFLVTLSLIACGTVWGQVGLDGLIQIQPYEARRSSSANEDLHSNGDGRAIAAGETLVLAELEGPGIISHIWTTVGSSDPFASRSLVLRMYWDGAEHPSVQAPLGDFYGVGHGASRNFVSQPVAVSGDGRSRNCYWRMPFRKSAKVTVTNESSEYRCDSLYYQVDWQKHDTLPEDMPYFHAQYRQDMPAKPGDYTILETEGRGHYVGTVYSAHQVELGWFGEGDDRFYIDGEPLPSLRGTGTEDYFGDAWGFREFSTPYIGVSLWEGYFPG
ncbi:MAG: glycoside hydrolase family 172 protein, partial [bacterium]